MSNNVIRVRGKNCDYLVRDLVGRFQQFRIYFCKPVGEERICFFKIAVDSEANLLLQREAYVLGFLLEWADSLEKEYALQGGKFPLNYKLCFPQVRESLVTGEDQGKRQALVLQSEAVDDLCDLVPISHIRSRDKARVDPKTSAWILGKLLKILVFTHSQSVLIGNLTADNILIVKGEHLVSIFDWSKAWLQSGFLPEEAVQAEIREVAQKTCALLGGDPSSGEIPTDEQLSDERYQTFLKELLTGRYRSAQEAHGAFYELITDLWGRSFHPYSVYPLLG